MIGRYVVEIILVVLCGMGLRPTEIVQIGGNEVVVKFLAVSYSSASSDVQIHSNCPKTLTFIRSHTRVSFCGSQ